MIDIIFSGMFTIVLVTLFFSILKVFGLDIVQGFLNQTFSLMIILSLVEGIVLYIMVFRKRPESNKKSIGHVYVKLFLIAHSMTVLYIFMQSHQSFIETMDWIYSHVGHFVLTLIFIYIVYIFTYSLLGRMFWSVVLTSCIFVSLMIVNYFKLTLRGDPLYPSDFTQITHMKSVIPMVIETFSLKFILIGIVCILVCVFTLKYIHKQTEELKIDLEIRIPLIIGSVFIMYAYTNYTHTFMDKLFQKWDVNFAVFNQPKNYNENGLVLGFISNLGITVSEESTEYDTIIKVAKDIKKEYKSSTPNQKVGIEPNIVFLMSEAFWDPTKLKNLTFNEDPLPNLHHYTKNYPAGQTVSPTFGGNTANTEFEALTGYSMSYVNPIYIPYQHLVTNQSALPSMVSELKSKGYQTTALHSYDRSFFKRDEVYSILGFTKFNAIDSMKHKETDGNFISDLSMSKEIMEELNNATKPTFIHAVTMQNHYPFTPGKHGVNKVKISGLSKESTAELETYTEGVRRSDEALRYLVEQIQSLDRPTLLVFFGDHLPVLGTDKSIYKESGYITNEEKISERLALAETPLLVYGNYSLPKDDLGLVSPMYFSNLIFDYAGLQKSPFYEFLSQLQKEIPVLRDELRVNSQGKEIKELSDKQTEMLQQYKVIQNDLLTGKQYSKDILF